MECEGALHNVELAPLARQLQDGVARHAGENGAVQRRLNVE